MIRNILLDLDDTILDFQMAERVALQKTLVQVGIAPTPEVVARYQEINEAQWKLLELGQTTIPEIKRRRFAQLYEELGIRGSSGEATECYEEQLAVGHYFVEGAQELLGTLHEKSFRLYLASNGVARVQHSRIASAGIGKYFSGIFISQEIGYAKPSEEYFQYCFRHIPGFQKEETMILGDSLTSDMKGGLQAGITTVWFHPGGKEQLSDIRPHYQIRRLEELPGLLERIGGGGRG